MFVVINNSLIEYSQRLHATSPEKRLMFSDLPLIRETWTDIRRKLNEKVYYNLRDDGIAVAGDSENLAQYGEIYTEIAIDEYLLYVCIV